jgi:ectoine hydroxylase-related dioxygenase (phytanoyl-CoA dioxygenase family)
LKNFHEWVSTSFPNHRVTGDWRFKPHLHLVFVNRIVHHPALISAVQQVLQTKNLLLWSCDFNIKYPETEAWYPPHQDATYAGLHPTNQCVTAWVALSDPVSDKEGCLIFWKGSHRLGQLPHEENVSKDNNNLLSRGQRITSTPDEQLRLDDGDENSSRSPQLVSIPLRGGEATLHNFYTIHKSGPNRSKYPRVGLALRYIDAAVRQTGSVRESVTLVSGKTIHDGFDLEPILPIDGSATSEDIQRGKEAHRDSMQRESANYFDGSTADTR